ncbi:Citrate (Re)-synthase [Desulfovibrionales bacterium]
MKFLNINHGAMPRIRLDKREDPELYRDLFPYTKISRITFDDVFCIPRPADFMFITDTTFRDGQQARPPYTVEQITHIFSLLHKLGGMSGLIQASEFFMYSNKDHKAIEACRAKNYAFPSVTGWIRANLNDLKIARSMEFDEVGMLTSVSDYHIYLKLGKNRQTAMKDYLALVEKALEWGIAPRCHFEDVTRADIYGFCLPFAVQLKKLSDQSGLPIKIRLCDTLGYGVPYPNASLPRSVPRIVRAFTDDAGIPGKWLEWHGHNDFHKALINASTAWLYGCGGVNGTLLGFGERTGNTPVEGLVIEYISLTGQDDAANTQTITEISAYFEKKLGYTIPDNYPFVGRDFNATRAGVHMDGLFKNEEIYNIFDTRLILGRPVSIIITDKSGRAGVAYWINQHLDLPQDKQVTKRHPAVGKIYNKIMAAYETGRITSFSNKEITNLAKRYLPELFTSDLEKLKQIAQELAAHIILKLSENPYIQTCLQQHSEEEAAIYIYDFLTNYPFIQFMYLVDTKGNLVASGIAQPEDVQKYKPLIAGENFSDREWFVIPLQTGKMHITNFYQSKFTGHLCLTVAMPVANANDDLTGILGADIRLEELLKRQADLEDEVKGKV